MTAPAQETTFVDVEGILRKWIEEEGHPILEMKADPEPTWAFAVAYNPNPDAQVKVPIAVIGREEKNRIEIVLRAELSPEHKTAVNKKTLAAKSGLGQLRSTLLMGGVGFAMIHGPRGEITALNFDDILYPDGPLTHDGFMRSMRRLYSTFVYSGEILSKVSAPQAELLE